MTDVLSIHQLAEVSKQLHKENKKIVLTGGCFDILHIGHITLLENAKKEGNVLMVMLESDESIKLKKGINRPIHTQKQRTEMLSSIRYVDYVIQLPQDMTNEDYDSVVKHIRPAIIAATSGDPYAFHKERQAKETDAKVVYVNKSVENISTTSILDLLTKEL